MQIIASRKTHVKVSQIGECYVKYKFGKIISNANANEKEIIARSKNKTMIP